MTHGRKILSWKGLTATHHEVSMKLVLTSFALCLSILSLSLQAETCQARAHHQSMRNSLGKKCEHAKDRFNCVDVKEVTDGDTLSINIIGVHPYFGEDTSVRLYGLDTPESRPPTVKCIKPAPEDSEIDKKEYDFCKEAERLRKCEITASKEATKILDTAICSESDRIDIELVKDSNGGLVREKYGRILGTVTIVKYNGNTAKTTNAQDLLLNERLAFPYGGGTKPTRDWCSKQILREPKLQNSYVSDNFCSSRKCTEKTYQTRCFHRGYYSTQVACYQERIDDNIGRWVSSCRKKTGKERRDCLTEKTENYFEFCRQYDSSATIKTCKKDLSQTIEAYCKAQGTDFEEDCLGVL